MPIKNKKSSSKTTTSPLKTQQENIIIPPSPSTTMNPITANNNHDNNTQSTSTVKSNALPSTDPLHELQRLGGVSSVLKLLDSRKTNLRETAALVLSIRNLVFLFSIYFDTDAGQVHCKTNHLLCLV